MSFGGVHPMEWILPPLALNHALINTITPLNTPGSSAAKQASAAKAAEAKQAEQQKLSEQKAQETAAAAQPLSPDDQLASRQRLASASDFITGQKRAARTLGAA